MAKKAETNKKIEPNKKTENEEKLIPFGFCIVVLALAVFLIPMINNQSWKKTDNEELKEETETTKIPSTYSCTYGPIYDEFYDYIKTDNVVFKLKDGRLSSVNSTTSYQAATAKEYAGAKSNIIINSSVQTINYDDVNYIITVKTNTNEVDKLSYPKNYEQLKKYLSQGGYTCAEN